jgi:hypothetical protein
VVDCACSELESPSVRRRSKKVAQAPAELLGFENKEPWVFALRTTSMNCLLKLLTETN